MSDELKPCPFCGNAPVVNSCKFNPYARCETDGCKGSKLPMLNMDDPSDIAAWNMRAVEDTLKVEIESLDKENDGMEDAMVQWAKKLEVTEQARDFLNGCRKDWADQAARMKEQLDAANAKIEQLQAQVTVLDPMHGDVLPPIGSTVWIRLASRKAWIAHKVTGYYVWKDLKGSEFLHRVFVRVVCSKGFPNARMLCDIKTTAPSQEKE